MTLVDPFTFWRTNIETSETIEQERRDVFGQALAWGDPLRDLMLIDLRYAMRQLREFRCIDRAMDALERVEEQLVAEGEGDDGTNE